MSGLIYDLRTRIEANVTNQAGVEIVNGNVYYNTHFKKLLKDAKVSVQFKPNGAFFSRGKDNTLLPYQILPNRHGQHLTPETVIKFYLTEL